jgi:hypothetical protein
VHKRLNLLGAAGVKLHHMGMCSSAMRSVGVVDFCVYGIEMSWLVPILGMLVLFRNSLVSRRPANLYARW